MMVYFAFSGHVQLGVGARVCLACDRLLLQGFSFEVYM